MKSEERALACSAAAERSASNDGNSVDQRLGFVDQHDGDVVLNSVYKLTRVTAESLGRVQAVFEVALTLWAYKEIQ